MSKIEYPITLERAIEIATKFKDALVDNTTMNETITYAEEELDMTEEEKLFFGLTTEWCYPSDCYNCLRRYECEDSNYNEKIELSEDGEYLNYEDFEE